MWARASPKASAGLVGRARGLTPVALIVGGGAMLMAPVLPALRPLRTGGLCLGAAIVLALAAGTLGVSAGTPEGAQWSTSFLSARGGALGELMYVTAHRLVQEVGVDILVVFLLIVGVILLTGASLATALRATGTGMVDTTRMLRTLASRFGDCEGALRAAAATRPRARRSDRARHADSRSPSRKSCSSRSIRGSPSPY